MKTLMESIDDESECTLREASWCLLMKVSNAMGVETDEYSWLNSAVPSAFARSKL